MTLAASPPVSAPSGDDLVEIDPRTDPRWPSGSLFTSPRWIRAVCATYDFTPQALVLVGPDGAGRAGLAWALVDDARGARRVALPFSDRADPPGAGPAEWARLRDAALAGSEIPLALRCLDGHPAAADPSLVHHGEAAWHATALVGDEQEVHHGLDGRVRRALRRADDLGLRVELGRSRADLHRFHGLHVELRRRKYRLLAPPVELFDRLAEECGDDLLTTTAWLDGELVAGAVFVLHDGVLYYKFGASRAEHLGCRPNESLAWAAIRWGLARGATSVDWGVSDLDQPGLLQYKRKWATSESRVLTMRSGSPRPDSLGPVLGELTALLTRDDVPSEITTAAGALLYRYFC